MNKTVRLKFKQPSNYLETTAMPKCWFAFIYPFISLLDLAWTEPIYKYSPITT